MANEQSKAVKRRYSIGSFHNRYFIGNGIDIGGGNDGLDQYVKFFPLLDSVKVWDLKDGDAQEMLTVENETYDFVVSSHCLEHMVNVDTALFNWIRIVKPKGYLVITIPDEDLYEMGRFPSQYNSDHKHTFTINKESSWSPCSINIFDLLSRFKNLISIEKIELILDFYDFELQKERIDQTLHRKNTESCIEIILQKQ